MNIGQDISRAITNFENNIAYAQEKFVESGLSNIFNTAIDTGIRIALPEVVEDVAISVKDALFENGLKDGVKQIWNNLKNFGKSALGIVTGSFESIEQIQTATKTGGVLDMISKIFDFALNKAVDNEKLTKSERQSLKNQKNSFIKEIKSKVSESLEDQVVYVERIQEYSNKWQSCFDSQDLNGMKNANRNIQKYLEKTLPLENVLKNARKIEIMQNLVESTGSFEITEEEKELASALSY